jgi:hypothetical protein
MKPRCLRPFNIGGPRQVPDAGPDAGFLRRLPLGLWSRICILTEGIETISKGEQMHVKIVEIFYSGLVSYSRYGPWRQELRASGADANRLIPTSDPCLDALLEEVNT